MGSVIGAVLDPILGTDISGNKGASNAIRSQNEARELADQTLGQSLDRQVAEFQPWKEAGMSALANMKSGNMQMDPGYQFRLDEGNKAINAAAAARGLGSSGRTMKELARYGQDYASGEYNNAFNRQNTLANYGNNASNNTASSIANWGQSIANNRMGIGNAQAAQQISQANRMGNDINQMVTAGAMLFGGPKKKDGEDGGVSSWFSDRRLKTNIVRISPEELDDVRPLLKAYAYNYKKEMSGEGDWVGPMAQEFEKTKYGKTVVFEDEFGNKKINLKKVLSLFLATLAEA